MKGYDIIRIYYFVRHLLPYCVIDKFEDDKKYRLSTDKDINGNPGNYLMIKDGNKLIYYCKID